MKVISIVVVVVVVVVAVWIHCDAKGCEDREMCSATEKKLVTIRNVATTGRPRSPRRPTASFFSLLARSP